jgi:hypothetical protein
MRLNRYHSSESFIPIQRIINDKVKLTFNDYRRSGNYGIYKKKIWKNISFNYDRTESDPSAVNENALSEVQNIDSWQNVFDTLQTNRLDNQIWKWFVISCTTLSGN